MVQLVQLREGIPIRARRVPERITLAVTSDEQQAESDRIVVCNVPDGSRCLYVSRYRDAYQEVAAAALEKGPYGFNRLGLCFHLVLWDGRPVWISSEDAELVDAMGDQS
jgi:hypothetical protein